MKIERPRDHLKEVNRFNDDLWTANNAGAVVVGGCFGAAIAFGVAGCMGVTGAMDAAGVAADLAIKCEQVKNNRPKEVDIY